MLHRLSELDGVVREGYDGFEFKKITRALIDFANVELSAFYFDVRKDTLYCDAPSSLKRRAALSVIAKLFDCLVTWLAPMLPFTTEEAWLSRYPDAESVHLAQFPEIPANWKNDALEAKWEKIRKVRTVVTGALEVERREKRIGSSLEAAPVVHIADADLLAALKDQDFAEICITSAITVVGDEGPADGFRLPEVPKVVVEQKLAEGVKCARSWRITTDVGSDPDYPDVSAAMRRPCVSLPHSRNENDRMNCALPLHPVHLPENGRICTAMRAAACRKTMSGEVGRTAGRVSMKTMQGNAQGLGMFRTVVGVTTIGVLLAPAPARPTERARRRPNSSSTTWATQPRSPATRASAT